MISHQHKCIHIHIPKCAGTSIESALGHFEDYDGAGRQDHRPIAQYEPLNMLYFTRSSNILMLLRRARYNVVRHQNPRNNYFVTNEQYHSYFKFSLVRNPWARAYSWYRGLTKGSEFETLKFEKFLKSNVGKKHLRSQMYYLKDSKGEIPLDFVGKFENLSEDFGQVCKEIGIDNKLPHILKGQNEDYRYVYSRETKALVEKVYKEEIQYFGYKFD